MKKINKIISLYVALIAMLMLPTSCSEEFLDRVPTSAISDQTVFTTTENARAALNGIHRFMFVRVTPPNSQDAQGHGSIMITIDMLGEDLVMTAPANGWYNGHYQWINHRTDNFRLPDFAFRFYYRIVANANAIISNIDNAEGPQRDKNEIKAQALCYRAFCHFMLVQLYGQRYDFNNIGGNTQLGVPIVLDNQIIPRPRATVEEVYTQIKQDLADAIDLFGDATPRVAKSHFNINVANGLLARVALTTGDWTTASSAAIAARQSFTLNNEAQYKAGFNDVSLPEWMWGSQQIQDQQTFFASFFAYMSRNFSSSNIRGNPKCMLSTLHNQIPDTDYRKDLWDPNGLPPEERPTTGSLTAPYANRKFVAASSSLSIGDVPYMRASEMYLIEAEAKARLGQDGAEPLFQLNSVRDTDYVKSTSTGQALIDEIWFYRRVELWGEGFRFLDLKRNNLPLDRQQGVANHNDTMTAGLYAVPAGDPRWQFIISINEINANPLMVQNP